jgi:RNA polymerase primary sigma factor
MEQHTVKGEVDGKHVARVVDLAMSQSSDGGVAWDDLKSILAAFATSAEEGDAVLRELDRRGIELTGKTHDPANSAVVYMPSEAGTQPPVRALDPSDVAPAIEVARKLLQRNSRSRRARYGVLTAQEEVGLAAIIRGPEVALNEELPPGYCGRLPRDDERAVAFQTFMLNNMRLVYSIARNSYGVDGLDEDDINNYGMIGLVRAVEKWDATRNLKFSTYATWWIRQAISRGIGDDARLIRIPIHMLERINKVNRVRQRLSMEFGGCSVRDIANETGLSSAEVIEALRLNAGVVSLDKLVGDEDGASLGDFVAEDWEHVSDPAVLLDRNALREIVENAIDELPTRKAVIMSWRHGFATGDPETLDQIGKLLGVTRERVRQLEKEAAKELQTILESRGVRPKRPELLAVDQKKTKTKNTKPTGK